MKPKFNDRQFQIDATAAVCEVTPGIRTVIGRIVRRLPKPASTCHAT